MTPRKLETEYFDDNPLLHWPEKQGRIRTVRNIVVTQFAKILPLRMKNALLRKIGVEIGENTAIALGVQLDIFNPEKISIGSGSVIGYGTTVLTHETTTERFSTGKVEIGSDVLVGANSTILPGVKIGDGASISANSLVNRDVETGEKVEGVPIKGREDDGNG